MLSRMSAYKFNELQKAFSGYWLQSKKSFSNILQIPRKVCSKIKRFSRDTPRIYASLQQNVQRAKSLSYSEIREIKYLGEEKTYDINVKNNHNFFANGFLVHNCLEEAQGLAEEVIDQKLLPMTAWTNGTTVMIGTVEKDRVPFFVQIEQNREADTDKPDHLKSHIEFDFESVIKYNARYAKHVASVIKKYGKDSVYFKMSYGLEWQFGATQPITYETLIRYTYSPKVSIIEYSDDPVVISIDLAKENDLTVTTVLKIPRVYMEYEDGVFEYVKAVQVLNWFVTGGMKYTQQRPLIKDFLCAYPNIVAIVVDTTGVGNSVFEEMQREWNYLCEWYPFVFSPKSKQELTVLWEEYFYSNRLIVPSDQQAKDSKHQRLLLAQATKQKKVIKQNFTYFTSLTDSTPDDYFWSWLLGVWGVHKIIQTGLEVESNPGQLYRPSIQPIFTGLQNRRDQVKAGEAFKLGIREQRLAKWGK